MGSKRTHKRVLKRSISGQPAGAIFFIAVSELVAVPLILSTAFHRTFAVPKFAVLIIGSAALVPLLFVHFGRNAGSEYGSFRLFRNPLVYLTLAYLATIAISTFFGIARVTSLMGTFENQMGLLTYLCFVICFVALIAGIGFDEHRLTWALWALALTGLATSIYALFQFAGWDPLIPASAYTFDFGSGPIVRPIGTLGHADYLGNFLLYTCPVSLALAVRSHQRERRVAIAGFALSIAAILVSGTRGAWLGILAGLGVIAVLEFRAANQWVKGGSRRRLLPFVAAALASAAVLALAIGPAASGRSILERGRSVFADGLSGAGRTRLWKDSLKMIPRYALVGCGPEAFREALLPYKSKALALISPPTNNESSHISYIDAAVSYGLPGAVLYVSIFCAMLIAAIKARKRVDDPRSKWILTGIVSSVAAVAVHDFFIFNQLSTGLYFFALAALCQAASNTYDHSSPGHSARQSKTSDTKTGYRTSLPGFQNILAVCLAVILAGPAIWYSIGVCAADQSLKESFAAAERGDYQELMSAGTRAAAAPDPTGSFHFMVARALSDFADRAALTRPASNESTANTASQSNRPAAIHLAIDQAGQALPHNLERDSVALLLAYLEGQAGDVQSETRYAREAVALDPEYANCHLMLSEAYLAAGNKKEALEEAYAARELDPSSRTIPTLIMNAGGPILGGKEYPVSEMVVRAEAFLAAGDLKRALRMTRRMIRREPDCAPCHRIRAQAFEKAEAYKEAISEWQKYLALSPGEASAQKVPAHIEDLKKQSPP
ncbi:MAG TPA: O-antigen ligase family protein [Blastocatellia bacterium]|nr:O-antigen ligase family protein [Blastocatellia bacterium]